MRYQVPIRVSLYKIRGIRVQRYSRCSVTEKIWTLDQEGIIEWNVHDAYDFWAVEN